MLRAFGYASSLKAKYVITDEIPSTESDHEPPKVFELAEQRERLWEFANQLLLNGKHRARVWVAHTVCVVLKHQRLRFPPPEKGIVASLQGDQVLYSSGRHYVIVYPRILEEILGFATTHLYQNEEGNLRVRVPTREGQRYGMARGHEIDWMPR